jgi:hypothetical protein
MQYGTQEVSRKSWAIGNEIGQYPGQNEQKLILTKAC